ncbi:hypothetical protein SAMN05443144_109136 [Fodinibius roseus]|uniref:Uncharacterized protein n=1 Tax=Fodinibius roseus TaxID=1194090 RepID=A0A1M5C883_9BACT|nr:hypothetical protein SAMN05443144_109136 [Fodinibius roseus]
MKALAVPYILLLKDPSIKEKKETVIITLPVGFMTDDK